MRPETRSALTAQIQIDDLDDFIPHSWHEPSAMSRAELRRADAFKKFLASAPALTQNSGFDGGPLPFLTGPLLIFLR